MTWGSRPSHGRLSQVCQGALGVLHVPPLGHVHPSPRPGDMPAFVLSHFTFPPTFIEDLLCASIV